MRTAAEQLYKPFRVQGEEITSEHIRSVEWLLRRDRFTFNQMGRELIRAGVSYENHDRATDRLLQRARKMGLIVFMRGGWSTSRSGWATLRDMRHSPNGRDCVAGSGRSPSGAVPNEDSAIAQPIPESPHD